VRILIVAPDLAGVDAISEVRRIQQWHDVALLHGPVTADDIYRACQEKAFDVLHFAAHGGPAGISLSSGVLLQAEEIAQFARLRETRGLFFSACSTGSIASYCVRHGATWAISSEVNLPDADAWKLAAAFYSHQRNRHVRDFVGAYTLADSGDGNYALHVSPDYIQALQRDAARALSAPHALVLTRRDALVWASVLLGLAAGLSAVVSLLAGRF